MPLAARVRPRTLDEILGQDHLLAPGRALGDAEIELIVRRALDDVERGLGGRQLELDPTALRHLVERANGDARVALNALELAADAVEAVGASVIDLASIEDAVQQRALLYDKAGDAH